MTLLFYGKAWKEYLHWQENDATVLKRLNNLLGECQRTPFTGTGKPEPLKSELRGWWSRRITQEDRLVYRVVGQGEAQRLEIVQCRYNY